MSTLFKYEPQGALVTFLDEGDQYDNETIRKHWQGTFPELGNCQADVKVAKEGETLKARTQDGAEVEVNKVVTFVKKVGTKGMEDRRIFYDAAEQARFRATLNDPARKRLIDAAPMLVQLCKRLLVQASAVLERPCEVNFTALQIAVNDGVEAVARVTGEWPDAPQTPAWQPGDEVPKGSDRAVEDGLRTVRAMMAAPKMLAACRADRDLLANITESVVFYPGTKQAVTAHIARLDAVIREAEGRDV